MSLAWRRRRLRAVRHLSAMALPAALVLVGSPARAERPDPALAFLTGASVFLAGFAVGGVLLATSHDDEVRDNVGWLTMEGAFVLAPLASHALTGEGSRGFLFAAPPAAALASNAILFAFDPSTVEHGPLWQRYVLWTFLGAGVLSGAFGVIDSAFAEGRARALVVQPVVDSSQLGLRVGGTL
jgi:hypothetical protein